jgi:hypothetical protein
MNLNAYVIKHTYKEISSFELLEYNPSKMQQIVVLSLVILSILYRNIGFEDGSLAQWEHTPMTIMSI